MSVNVNDLDWSKGEGLLPAIVQDAETLQVLMLGYVNAESLQRTLDDGFMTFYSRSRQTLWQKGETSGNRLKVMSVDMDCDRDTLLVKAIPEGPTCHLGTISCFGSEGADGVGVLAELERVIASRKGADSESSYTADLFEKGIKRIAQKVGEEGVETALAAATGDKDELKNEAADLLYHLIVLLQASDMSLDDAIKVLKNRR